MLGRCVIILLYSVLLSFSAFSQKKNANEKHIHTLLDKADSFYKKDFDSAIYYTDQALSKIDRENQTRLYAKAILSKGTYLWFKPEYKSAFELLKFNLKNEDKLNSQLLGNTYFLIGNLFRKDHILDSSLVNYTKALKVFGNDTINYQDISRVYLEIGLIYSAMDDEPFAQKFYEQSMKFAPKTSVIKSHQTFIDKEPSFYDYERELELNLEILEIIKRMKNDDLLNSTYSSLATSYKKLGRYDKALKYQNEILELHRKMNLDENTNNTLYYIGELQLLSNKPKEAILFLKKAEMSSSDTLRLNIYNNLKIAYLKIGEKEKAITAMESYMRLKDAINDKNFKASIVEITAKYNDEQQKQQIQNLNLQNEAKSEKISNQRLTLASTIAGSAFLLLFGILLYRNYRSRQALNYSQLNFKLLQTQLNPHFMFNALNEIKLNLNSESKEETSDHLLAYSRLMRLILEGSDKDFIDIEDDVVLISKFLHLQQLVNDNGFEFEILVSDDLDTKTIQIPPMFTQPFLENAVLHGVKGKVGGKIQVSYTGAKNSALVTIRDNGKGFNITNKQSGKELHQSMGTAIIEQRIKNYKKLYNYYIEIETISTIDEGTEVKIAFPIK